jgi:hypothetical protein
MSLSTRTKEILPTSWMLRGSFWAIALLATIAAPAAAASASNWTERQLPPASGEDWGPPLSGVTCPTESLCVAVGGINTVAFSQSPTGAAARWHVVAPTYDEPNQGCLERGESVEFCSHPRGSLNGVSCAGEGLCVAVGYEGSVYVSTDPTGGADAWSVSDVNEGHGATHLISVSCPLPSFCAAVSGGSNNSNGGKVLTSTDPTAGQWQVTRLGSLDLRGISCGTPSLCVAVAREGRIFVSTNPTGGASAWTEAGTPGGPGDLEGVACVSTLLCAAGNLTGNILTSTDPAGGGATWSEANAGGSVQITGVSCPTESRCVAVDNNGDVLTSTDPTGGAGSWHFENVVPFRPTENKEGQPPRNALFSASCASISLCALVGPDGRIFTSTDPFSVPTDPSARKARRRPRTVLLFAEHFWKVATTRHHRIRARFRFYSPTRTRGFECKRDRGPYRRCRSPLRYWAGHGRHVLRVRAIGPTGLRGPAAIKRFRVLAQTRRETTLARPSAARLTALLPR